MTNNNCEHVVPKIIDESGLGFYSPFFLSVNYSYNLSKRMLSFFIKGYIQMTFLKLLLEEEKYNLKNKFTKTSCYE